MNITTTTRTTKGRQYTYYSVYCNRQRKTFKTKSEAQAFIKNAAEVKEECGRKAASVFADHGADILSAIETLKAAGFSPDHLKRAAAEYVSRFAKKHANATLQQAADAYEEFLKANRMKSTKTVALQAVKLFIEQVGGDRLPSEIGNGEVVDAMEVIGEGRMNATFNSILHRLKAFVAWAVRRDYPIDGGMFDKVERKLVAAKEPRYIKMDEIKRLFTEAKNTANARQVLALLTIQYFAGIRTCEILALKPQDYHFHDETPFIRVSRAKGASKGRRGRVVPLEPNCAKILRALFPVGHAPLIDKDVVKAANTCYKKADIHDHHNIGRHSFITYHIAKYGDEQRTITTCGTSKDMAAFHYKGLATKSDADLYFNIG